MERNFVVTRKFENNRKRDWENIVVSFLLSDCNGTRTHNHLVRKQTLNHLECGFTLKLVRDMIKNIQLVFYAGI